jgi:hydrogenase-4 component B
VTAELLLAGLVVWSAGAAIDLTLGASRRRVRTLPYLSGVIGSACVLGAAIQMVGGHPVNVDLGSLFGVGRTSLRLDSLAGLFLTLTASGGIGISACMLTWVRPNAPVQGRGLAAGYMLLLGAVTVIIVAGDAFTFLFAWESLTVAFYVLSGVRRSSMGQAKASWVTLCFSKSSGACLAFGFLLLASNTGSFTIAAWHGLPHGILHAAAYALIVAGFGTKVGLVPFQVWMPRGYQAATGPMRAAMAGLAVNVGFYGLWRMLGVLGSPPTWLVALVLVLGGLTALLGVVFAGVQSDLSRVIAFSSVENGGIIMVGYGVAMVGMTLGQPALLAVGLLAATLQVVAHAVAKSCLFVALANVEADRGGSSFAEVAGAAHSHPWSSATLAAGAFTLAGLPPTIGFVSEWFILEALMQQFRVHSLALRLSMAGGGALVALSAGVAALVFVRLLGFAVLGQAPSSPEGAMPQRGDRGSFGRAGLLLLGSGCLWLAAAAPWCIRYIALGLGPIVPTAVVDQALKSPWVLQPVFGGFSILSPTWLFVVIPVGLVTVALAAIALSRTGVLRIRRVPAWHSATAGVAGPDRYGAYAYANVLRHVLGNVLGSRREVVVVKGGLPAEGIPGPTHVEYQAIAVEPIEAYIYRPARTVALWAALWAKRLQSGRLDAYIAYMLVALVALLAVVVALG